jgi:hypothetical protein
MLCADRKRIGWLQTWWRLRPSSGQWVAMKHKDVSDEQKILVPTGNRTVSNTHLVPIAILTRSCLTYLRPRCRGTVSHIAVLQNLTVSDMPTISYVYETRRFIIMVTRARHCSLC